MTLIVGIICKDAIVLAADSQTTKGAAKQLGANKINVVEFANGKALVAEAGSADLSASAIHLFQRKASGRTIEDDSTVAKTAEDAVREIRASLRSLHPDCTSPDEWQNFFRNELNYFELMLAYYFDGKPRLYKLNPLWCVPVPATSHFMTSGIASDLANYILLEHTQPGMDCDFASIIAIKAVEDAIQHVEGCGSPPRVALILDRAPTPQPNLPTLRPLPTGAPPDKVEFFKKLHGISESLFNYNTQPVVIFLPKMVASLAKTIASIEQKTKDAKNKTFHSVMRKLAKQEFNQLIKTLDKAKVTIGDATPDNPNKNP